MPHTIRSAAVTAPAARRFTPPGADVSEYDPTLPRTEYDTLGPKVWVMGGAMLVLAVVALVLMMQDFSSTSYLYLAFYTIPANTAISLFPHEPVVIWYGALGSIWWTAAAASAGTLVAGFLDHSVFVPVMNRKGLTGYKEKAWYQKAAVMFMKYPFAVLVVAGFTPIPFFPFKFLSFSLHYRLWKYLSALLVGRFPRYALLAWVGQVIHIPGWLLVAVFAAIGIAYAARAGPELLRYLRASRSERP
jgi:membrane protein YqaA with SNARE-associated domain